MSFDADNNIVKLCAHGMNLEGDGKNEEAYATFLLAWTESTNDFEKLTAAHYLARQQKCIADKLKWDQIALDLALQIDDDKIIACYPSLYLNIAKCFEDLNDFDQSRINYESAFSFTGALEEDGYGKMITSGISAGMERINLKQSNPRDNSGNDLESDLTN